MNTKDHLMNENEFKKFCDAMWAELVDHMDEKQSLKYVLPMDVYFKCTKEIVERINIISGHSSSEERKKQAKHIANYCFFLYVKMDELIRSSN